MRFKPFCYGVETKSWLQLPPFTQLGPGARTEDRKEAEGKLKEEARAVRRSCPPSSCQLLPISLSYPTWTTEGTLLAGTAEVSWEHTTKTR